MCCFFLSASVSGERAGESFILVATGGWGPVVRSAMVVILSYLRAGRVSSDLRPIAAIADASGILDPGCRLRRGFVMPVRRNFSEGSEPGAMAEHDSAISRPRSPRVCMNLVPRKKEGAGNAGCLLHPRSRVHKCAEEAHTSIQVQTEQSGIPCAMALRLMPCSPRRRIRLVTVVSGLAADQARSS